ncbi:MAG TPA: PP2C family serine/threonine-protein phosphatase [Wenzhouxiangellaceae bacterium]|nr:PP2C family serine/threonine-protein phosphatase [Wenzhouxiangellaceae bacterium]
MSALPVTAGRIRAEHYLRTDTGTVRTRNEDNLLAMPEYGLWAVCDGMGGHDAGDYASTYIVEALQARSLPVLHGRRVRAIQSILAECNRHLVDYAQQNHFSHVGSTAVLLSLFSRRAAVIWVGDSRAYLLRGPTLRMISRDHNVAEQLLDDPENFRPGESSSAITRAIGGEPTLVSDLACVETLQGDCWLLCSDGVSGVLDETEIAGVMEQADDPASELVERALAAGSRDNCTAVVVRIESDVEKFTAF